MDYLFGIAGKSFLILNEILFSHVNVFKYFHACAFERKTYFSMMFILSCHIVVVMVDLKADQFLLEILMLNKIHCT